jgi:hypothetical protein
MATIVLLIAASLFCTAVDCLIIRAQRRQNQQLK